MKVVIINVLLLVRKWEGIKRESSMIRAHLIDNEDTTDSFLR